MPAYIRTAPPKDPDAKLDYTQSWVGWLEEGEEIATSEWFVEGDDEDLTIGVDQYAPTHDETSATVWLVGGTASTKYLVTNRITTDHVPPRIDDRSFWLPIAER